MQDAAPDQVVAFRLARSGLAARTARTLAGAAAAPASDVTRDAALLALAARAERVSREAYHRAVDAGDVVVAHALRGAIHAVAPADAALFGRALLATADDELGPQLGATVQRLTAEHAIAPSDALAEVAEATEAALAERGPLDRVALHAELRARVRTELLPWCRGCRSHHVPPMLWRYATVRAGARLDAGRRYVAAGPGAARAAAPPAAAEAVRRFLRLHGPSTPGAFAGWAGVARPHARRLWDAVAGELAEVRVGRTRGHLLAEDVAALEAPPAARGVRLLPPGDPYLQGPDRPLLVADRELRARLFRPVASPGAILVDGRLAGLWRARARGRTTELAVEPVAGDLPEAALAAEAERVAALRGAAGARLVRA